MDFRSSFAIHSPFLLISLLHLSYLRPSSPAYTSPHKYFINCGSNAEVAADGRSFVGDVDPDDSFRVSKSETLKNADSPQSTLHLYRTARFYTRTFSYELEIQQNGTFLVRLHYSPFSSPPLDLSSSLFNVSALGFLLQSNFRVRHGNTSPLIEEFILTLNIGKFRIYFTPHPGSIAFVNAVEVFLGFDDGSFVSNAREPRFVFPAGRGGIYSDRISQAMKTIHRINVGGSRISPGNDPLWRDWLPDDAYIMNKTAATNCNVYDARPNYAPGGSTEYIAPDLVYQTAKELRDPGFVNITWRFSVRKNARHLVRAHFCDIISLSLNLIQFNIYIYSRFGMKISPSGEFEQLATPFYHDFVVDSDDSGFMSISVGARADSMVKNAFMNGLEIMELVKDRSLSFRALQGGSGKNRLTLIIGLAGGGLVLVCILPVAFLAWLKYRRATAGKVESAQTPVSSGGKGGNRKPNASPIHNLSLGLKIPLAEIQEATGKFDARRIVGEGGFGKVYRGILRDGSTVAVKRSEPGHGQGLPEFRSEILVLSRIRHCHLVSLIGYCDDWPEMIVVSEFMERGTLRDHLYSAAAGKPALSWEQRLEICIGAARGLHYLHSSSDTGIIHRDVKSTNILLDDRLVAKVADFGLSRSCPPDQTHVSTDVKGSIGYIDPEYFRFLQLTEKSDVYSFGVVLLEVLCARPAVDPMLPRDQVSLAEWGLLWQRRGRLEEIMDPSLAGSVCPESLRKFGETVEVCLRESGAERPHTRDVVWDLEYALQLQRTGGRVESDDDGATTDGSSWFPPPGSRRQPSGSFQRGDLGRGVGEYSDGGCSEQSSEMTIDGAG